MNKGAGLAVFLAVAAAAIRMSSGMGSQGAPPPAPHPSVVHEKHNKPPKLAAVETDYVGGCTAYKAEPTDSKPGPKPPVSYPEHAEYAGAKSVIDKFFGGGDATASDPMALKAGPAVHYAIAIVPDPRHTNLSLMFDRQMVAIQQAAQDEDYTYNSAWLPWSQETSTFTNLGDQQLSADLADQQEACPGVLLFRRSAAGSGSPNSSDIFADALVVLIVGEQPTAGVNQDQWENAVHAIHWLTDKNAAPGSQGGSQGGSPQDPLRSSLRILGPTFSGSLVSLDRYLKKLDPVFTSVQVLSGSVSGCSSIQWFLHQQIGGDGKPIARPVTFGTFQENDEIQIYRFLSYIGSQGVNPWETAVLSEDETAYGLHQDAKSPPAGQSTCDIPYSDGNRPLRLYYPRDMSALRAQYQKESIFDSATTSGSKQAHSILQDSAEAEDENKQASDTIPTYSGTLTPIAQESVLYGIVSDLRAHHPRYLLLRCTNPLDDLFLTRFFHRAYPEGRVVIVGQDLLLRREIDTTEFRGVFGISNYPLLPSDQHWSLLIDPKSQTPHAHRVFESHLAQGTYLAARYTFDAAQNPGGSGTLGPLSFERKERLPGYTDPYWLHQDAKNATAPDHPPTWLSVVGRDGFWPVAVLNEATTPKGKVEATCPRPSLWRRIFHIAPKLEPCTAPLLPASSMVRLPAGALQYNYNKGVPDRPLQFSLPLSWQLCALAAALLLLYQLYGLLPNKERASSGLFSVFRHDSTPSQQWLMAASCSFVMMILLEVATVALPLPSLDDVSNSNWLIGCCFLLPLAGLASFLYFLAQGVDTELPRKSGPVLKTFLVACVVLLPAYLSLWLSLRTNPAANLPLFYRMGHVTSGVSPLLPVLFISAGFYLWTWQSMAGNLLLCEGRPFLPWLGKQDQEAGWRGWFDRFTSRLLGLPVQGHRYKGSGALKRSHFRISQGMDKCIVTVASPLSVPAAVLVPPVMMGLGAIFLFSDHLPLLSLEGRIYNAFINLALLIAFMLPIAETSRLYWTWVELRRLLAALNRLRLRRTFARIRAVPATSLWGMSGNVQRIQYQFFAFQLDAAMRLSDRFSALDPDLMPALKLAVTLGRQFAKKNADRLVTAPCWTEPVDQTLSGTKVYIREVFAMAVGEVLKELLFKEWATEQTSLSLETSTTTDGDQERNLFDMELSKDDTIKFAEEFVCFHYIAYVQNILARMRTMILSMVCLFVAVCFAISFYPFVPRTQISIWMLANLAVIASGVIYVYAGMERDETLSYISNTRPGKLGGEFYIKIAAFLAGPVVGLLTTQFPGIADSVLGLLQPGLDAFK